MNLSEKVKRELKDVEPQKLPKENPHQRTEGGNRIMMSGHYRTFASEAWLMHFVNWSYGLIILWFVVDVISRTTLMVPLVAKIVMSIVGHYTVKYIWENHPDSAEGCCYLWVLGESMGLPVIVALM